MLATNSKQASTLHLSIVVNWTARHPSLMSTLAWLAHLQHNRGSPVDENARSTPRCARWDCRTGVTNVVTEGTRSSAWTMWVTRGHRRSQVESKGAMVPQISSIPCRFLLWEALPLTKYCCSLKVKTFPPKISAGWPRHCARSCSKNNIIVISVFSLGNILIVKTLLE